jgi:hypothetical protein
MPTVLRVDGFRLSFFAGDHEPAHVHCDNGDGVAIIEIASGNIRRTLGNIREKDVRRAETIVAEHRDYLQRAWTEFAFRLGASR